MLSELDKKYIMALAALKAIANPVEYLAEEAKKDDFEIDGQIALDAGYLKQIAQKMLLSLLSES